MISMFPSVPGVNFLPYQVSLDEFGGMISAAAALPKKFGFDWWQVSIALFKIIFTSKAG